MDPYTRVTVVYAIFSMAVVFVDPVFSLYLSQKGYEPIWLTLILSSFSLAMIYFAPLVGGISDNWGRRPLILGGILLEIIAYILYALFTNPFVLFFTRIIESLGYIAVALVAIAKLEDIVSEKKSKKKNTQIGTSLSIAKIGHVVGPLIGGIVANHYGLVSPFYLGALVLGLCGIWYYFQKHTVHPKPPLEKLAFNPIPTLKKFLQIKPFRGLSILVIAHQFTIPVFFVFLPLFIVNELGLGIEAVGLALFVKEIPQVLQFLAGRLTDAWGSRKVMIVGTAFCGVAMLALSFTTRFDLILLFLFLYGCGTSMLGISSISLLSGIAEKMKREGTFLGSQIAISKVGAFAGFIASGIIVQLSGIPMLFMVSGTLLLLGLVLAEEYLVSHTFPIPKPRRLVAALFHHR